MKFNITKKMTEEEKAIYDKHKSNIPFEIMHFAKELNIELFLAYDLEDYISGFITYENGKHCIVVNNKHSEVRNRFTIAYQLGHFFYDKEHLIENARIQNTRIEHGDKFATEFANELQIPTRIEYQVRGDKFATEFANELLVPEEEFSKIYVKYANKEVEEIAKYFNVPCTVIEKRRNEIFGETL